MTTELWTRDAVIHWVQAHLSRFAKTTIHRTKSGVFTKYRILDPAYWAKALAEYANIGTYHGELWGLTDTASPIYRPIMEQVKAAATAISMYFSDLDRDDDMVEVVGLGKIQSRVNGVAYHLENGIVPRPSSNPQSQIAWDEEYWNRGHVIPFTNGGLDPDNLHLRPLTPEDRMTWGIDIPWIGDLSHAEPWAVEFFDQHMESLFGRDADGKQRARLLLAYTGLALAPWVRGTQWQKIVLLIGDGQNGKGTWIRMLAKLLGEYYTSLNLSDFDDSTAFGLEPALNALLIAVPDLTDTARIDGNARIKNISGDDMVSVNRKNQKQLSVRLPGRIWMAGPKMPKAQDNSNGWHRRLTNSVIHFDRKQPSNDPDYEKKLGSEAVLSVIVFAAVNALRAAMTNPQYLEAPTSSQILLEEYMSEMDPYSQWTDPEEGFFTPDEAAFTTTDRLYKVYVHWWTAQSGQRFAPKNTLTKPRFSSRLQAHLSLVRPRQGAGRMGPRGYHVAIQPQWDRLFED